MPHQLAERATLSRITGALVQRVVGARPSDGVRLADRRRYSQREGATLDVDKTARAKKVLGVLTELATAQTQRVEVAKKYGGREAYNAVVSDGKTRLNYGQWLQVRTPNFKAWFGDLEAQLDSDSRIVDQGQESSRPGAVDEESPPGVAKDDARGAGRLQRAANGKVRSEERISPEVLELATGEPKIFYHRTRDEIFDAQGKPAFDLNHPNRKDQGWLGIGVYSISDPRRASIYSMATRGSHGPNILPLVMRLTL